MRRHTVAEERVELGVLLQEAIGLLAEMEGFLANLMARMIALEHRIARG
jgi:hypothetical protein